jgi:predicted nucleic acid-binding protein
LFCRFTPLGFLRLLTNPRVMGSEVKSQRDAWRVYDRWFSDPRIGFIAEPAAVEPALREWTQSPRAISNIWPEAYLAAIAGAGGHTLLTLDQGFARFDGLDVVVLPSQGLTN